MVAAGESPHDPDTISCKVMQIEMMRTEEREELAALKGVVQTPNRLRCATLAWDAMRRALPTL